VAAVNGGLLSINDLCERYCLTLSARNPHPTLSWPIWTATKILMWNGASVKYAFCAFIKSHAAVSARLFMLFVEAYAASVCIVAQGRLW